MKRRTTISRPFGTEYWMWPAAESPALLVLHRINQLKKLGSVHNLDEGLALCLVADYINRWRVIDANTLASVLVFVDCRRQFPLRIDHERQVHFVVSGEFFRGTARRQSGHCRSSNTTRATCAPLGGRSAGSTVWAEAREATNRNARAKAGYEVVIDLLDAGFFRESCFNHSMVTDWGGRAHSKM